jgi:extracellular elastinolytic metalloproteinase
MTHQPRPGLRATGIAVATVASLAVAGLAGTSYATGSGAPPAATQAPRGVSGQQPADAYIDVTDQGVAAQIQARKSAAVTQHSRATRSFLASQPAETVLDTTGTNGTVRWMGRLDGFLTPASDLAPSRIALSFVRHHVAALGLVPADLATFHLHRDYRDITGTHHLFFQQRIRRHVVARFGLVASVNRAGHLLTLSGSPVSTASRAAAAPAQPLTITSPTQALAETRGPVPAGADLSQDTATRLAFPTATGLRPAWETVVMSSEQPATTVIDAVTGEVLLRHPLTNYEHSTGRVFSFFPGAKHGGRQFKVDFTQHHWLKANARRLSGNNSHTFSDVNDNDRSSNSEEVHPQTGHAWSYRLQPFRLPFARSFCSNPWPCSWNPDQRFSWRVNRAQNATQVFYFVNKWHDHLEANPIGFTEAAGNFQLKNHSKNGKGGDPVATQTDDGANSRRGLPDEFHIDNANMSTPPDGRQPTMQMYLQHAPGTDYSSFGDPYSPTNVGDEADTVYHEYTHGLSNRLNVDVQGRSTLGGVQGGAMGEAWSDWYAMDFLAARHLQQDRPAKADVRMFVYDGKGVRFDRTEPIDCRVGQRAKLCNGADTGHRGGYTYADYGQVVGGPEVHSDGEIWAQTLWSLRARLGSRTTESLVTRAMELAPYNPSFIDMRNAILVADESRNHGADQDDIWSVFASRGMGFNASSNGGNDTAPVANFNRPPKTISARSITGTVTDGDSGAPVSGVPVTLGFQGSGIVNPTTVTRPDGSFTLSNVPEGTYGGLQVLSPRYRERTSVTVGAHGATVHLTPRSE